MTKEEQKVTVRSYFSPRVKVTAKCEGKSLTQQSFLPDSDINNILRRYSDPSAPVRLWSIDPCNIGTRQPLFGDFSDVPDLQTAMKQCHNAETMFNGLPSAIRARFDNDPVKMYAFVADSANKAECQKLGILPLDPVTPVINKVSTVAEGVNTSVETPKA